MSRSVLAAIVCVFVCSAMALGDEVRLKNGDRLSGQIVRLTDGKLVLKSELAGEITVNLGDIQTFSSSTPLEVHLKDGTVLHQPVAGAEPEKFAIAAGETLQPQTFNLADVTSINPPPKPEPKWTGSISASLSSTHGNTVADSFTGSVNAIRRSEKDRITVSADFAKSERTDRNTGESLTTEDWWRAKGQYDYFISEKFFAFGNTRYEKDGIARLDRRVVLGGGGGYQWIETEATSFSTSLGFASVYEKFENQSDSNSEFSLQVGYNLSHQLWKNLLLVHDLTYYPSLDQFSDYYLTTTGELRTNLTKRLFASFKTIFNFDATPAPNQGTTDVKYILGIGLSF